MRYLLATVIYGNLFPRGGLVVLDANNNKDNNNNLELDRLKQS